MKNRVPLSVFLNVKIKEPLEHQVYWHYTSNKANLLS